MVAGARLLNAASLFRLVFDSPVLRREGAAEWSATGFETRGAITGRGSSPPPSATKSLGSLGKPAKPPASKSGVWEFDPPVSYPVPLGKLAKSLHSGCRVLRVRIPGGIRFGRQTGKAAILRGWCLRVRVPPELRLRAPNGRAARLKPWWVTVRICRGLRPSH